MGKYLSLLMILFFLSCDKKSDSEDIIKNQDYRDLYIGAYNFKTIYSITSMCYGDDTTPCVDGWKNWGFDTLYFKSTINKLDSNMLYIQFMEKELDGYNDSIILTSEGKILSQTFPNWGHNSFAGRFIGKDSVWLKLNMSGGIGGYETYETIGVKEK